MELREAKMCLDCEEIYTGESCPKCGREIYWWLSKFIHVMRGTPLPSAAKEAPPCRA